MFAKGGAEAVREQNVPEDDEREQGGMSSIVSSSEGVPGGSCSGSGTSRRRVRPVESNALGFGDDGPRKRRYE